MLIGDPALARVIFAPVWADISNYTDPLVGRFNGSIRPYDDAIEAAFALDESTLAVIAPPDLGPPPAGLRVMLLSYSPGALSNDMAGHFARSAEVAGVSVSVHYDSALVDPSHFVGTDQQVGERLGAFLDDHPAPDLGITFVGSVVWRARYLLLSVLMTEGIGLTAVFGPHRAAQTPDTRAYARLLARSHAVLNVSRHSLKVHLVTGRVWETIATIFPGPMSMISSTSPASSSGDRIWRRKSPPKRRPGPPASTAASGYGPACWPTPPGRYRPTSKKPTTTPSVTGWP
jgi:hypothetical protein